MSMRDKDDLYQEYLKCYFNGKSLKKLKSDTEEFQVFSMKKGLPVKYVSTKDILNLPMDDQLIGKNGFYRRQKGFYLIPNDFKNKILSFVIRGLTHEYYDIPCLSKMKPMFGWNTFTKFKKNTPIIVTEGSKDCIILQQYYPYTLAMLTAGITTVNANILKSMTNKIIMAYDRDKAGSDSTLKDVQQLKRLGIQVQIIRPHNKDFGKDYKNSNYIKEMIEHKLQCFSKLGDILL